MIMFQRAVWVFILLATAVFLSCAKKEEVAPPKGAKLTGTVSLIGAPSSEGVEVKIETLGISTTTDAKGNFVLSGIPEGTWEIVLSKPGYPEVKVKITVEPGKEEVNVGKIEVEPAGFVSGTITLEGATTFEDVSVTLTTEDGTVVASATTDKEGKFEMKDLKPGNYILVAEMKKPGVAYEKKSTPITVEAGKTASVELKLTRVGINIDPGKLGEMYHCAFSFTVHLDGKFDDWPVGVPWHKVPPDKGTQPAPNENDASYEFACVADSNYLYIAFKVYDDVKKVDENKACDVWQDDSVEIYIDGGNEAAGSYDNNDSQITIGRENVGGNVEKPVLGGCVGTLQGPNTGTKAAVVDTPYGWAVEAALPLETWGIKIRDGLVIGFNTHLNDDDDGGGRDHKLIWSNRDPADQSWTNPSCFAKLTFVKVK